MFKKRDQHTNIKFMGNWITGSAWSNWTSMIFNFYKYKTNVILIKLKIFHASRQSWIL